MSFVVIGSIGAFFLGTVFGSFANVLVYRMRELAGVLGRSRCPECRITIRPRHLIPIFSWLLLKGRCASCGKRIHVQYPLVEAATGMLFLIAFLRHPAVFFGMDAAAFLFETVFAFILVTLVAFDMRWKLLPIEFMAGTALAFAAWNAWHGMSWMSLVAGVAFGVAFLLVQVVFSRGKWMGSGDPWLGGLIGAALGWPRVGIAFYLTYLLGGVVAVFLLASGIVKRGARIPFAPLLSAGAFFSLWFGAPIEAYLARLFA